MTILHLLVMVNIWLIFNCQCYFTFTPYPKTVSYYICLTSKHHLHTLIHTHHSHTPMHICTPKNLPHTHTHTHTHTQRINSYLTEKACEHYKFQVANVWRKTGCRLWEMKETNILCEQKAALFIVTVTYGLKSLRVTRKNLSQSQRDQNNISEQNELFMLQYAYKTITCTIIKYQR